MLPDIDNIHPQSVPLFGFIIMLGSQYNLTNVNLCHNHAIRVPNFGASPHCRAWKNMLLSVRAALCDSDEITPPLVHNEIRHHHLPELAQSVVLH